MSEQHHNRFENVILLFVFLAVLAGFSITTLANCFINNDAQIELLEKRRLAAFPENPLPTQNFSQFFFGLQNFYNDRFFDRLELITIRNLLDYKLFGVSGVADVVAGKNGWLFYHRYSAGLQHACKNTSPFSPESLKLWASMLQARNDVLAQHGIKFLFVVAPEKSSIYPELLPSQEQRNGGDTRIEQLNAYLRQNTTVPFVDSKTILLQTKKQNSLVYLKTDSHWNDVGANAVAQNILEKIGHHFSEVCPLAQNTYSFGSANFTGDLAQMMNLRDYLNERVPVLRFDSQQAKLVGANSARPVMDANEIPEMATILDNKKMLRAVILRDSFGGRLAPILSERFSHAAYFSTYDFDLPKILAEKPDVVIDEMAERKLYEGYPDNVPVFIKRTNSLASSKDSACVRAVYSNFFDLTVSPPKKTTSGIFLRLFWRSKAKQKLDYSYGFSCLNDERKLLGGHSGFKQDFFAREVSAGDEWVDEIVIPSVDAGNASILGLVVSKDNAPPLHVSEGPSDTGGYRLLVPLK